MVVITTNAVFAPAPSGLLEAKIVEVKDHGTMATKFGTKHRVQIVWETTEAKTADGQPYKISKFYTATLAPKSTLRKDLTTLLGDSVVAVDQFDVEKLVGMSCQVLVVHINRDGKTYANVEGLFPMKGETK